MEITLVLFLIGTIFFSLLPFWVMTHDLGNTHLPAEGIGGRDGRRWDLLQEVLSFCSRGPHLKGIVLNVSTMEVLILSPSPKTFCLPVLPSVNGTTIYPSIQAKNWRNLLWYLFPSPTTADPSPNPMRVEYILIPNISPLLPPQWLWCRDHPLSPRFYNWNLTGLLCPSCLSLLLLPNRYS